MSILEELGRLYEEIRDCHICCPDMRFEKALRLMGAVNPQSDVFIISQALAEKQLRCSGVNFFEADGTLGKTGKNLEPFLNEFGRTVYPNKTVTIANNVTIYPKPAYVSVYNTEITQCYPGQGKKGGDRTPSDHEIANCLAKGFLSREMELIGPKLILLMGKTSRDTFFRHVLKTESAFRYLTAHLRAIIQTGKIPLFSMANRHAYVMPIQHASGANYRFAEMAKDRTLIELINEVLNA